MGLYDGVRSAPVYGPTYAQRPTLSPNNPPLTPEEIAANEGQALGPLAGGVQSGLSGLKASAAALYGTGAESVGARNAAAAAYKYARQQQEQAAVEGGSIPDWKDVHDASDLGSFVVGNTMRSLPYVAPAILAPAAARGLGAGETGRMLAGTAINAVPFAGGEAQILHDDPNTANMSPLKRLGLSAAVGTGQAALMEFPGHVMSERALGTPGYAAKPSLNPLTTAGNIAKDTAASSAGMGVGSGAGTLLQQEANTALDPARDRSHDSDELAASIAGGAAAMAPMALPHAVAAHTIGAARAPITDAARSVADKLPGAAGEVRDAAGNLVSAAQNVSAQNIGESVGKAVSAAKSKAEDLGDWLNNRDTDAKFLATEQRIDPTAPDKIAAIQRDDEVRNAAAERRATKIVNDEDAPAELKQAATDFLNGPKNADAWKTVQAADAQYTSQHRFVSSIDKIQTKLTRFGIKAGKAASDAVAGYEAGRKMNAQSTDPFDDLLTKTFMEHATSTDSTSAARMAQATPVLREWIANGFAFKKDGALTVPPELETAFKDPVAAVTAAHDLMQKQGLLDEAHDGRLQEVIAELKSREESSQGADATVEKYLLPTAQAEHQFSGADHQQIANHIKHMIERGKIDDPTLDKLFGANKEKLLAEFEEKFVKLKKGVLSPDDSTEHSTNLSDEHDADGIDADRAEAAAHGEDGISDAVKPNEMKAEVGWHGPYDFEREGAVRGHETRMKDLKTLGQNTKNVGVIDRLREEHAGNPEALVGAVVKSIKANEHNIPPEHAGKPDEYLNKRYRYVRSEDASDKREPIDIKGSEFDNVTGQGGTNKWGMSAGKNKEYGGPDNGRLWFERADTKVDKETGEITPKATEFNTAAGRIIARMREGMKDTGGGDPRRSGIINQHDMLMQGISSMLSAKNEDGKPALTGRVGIMRNGKVEWMKQGDKLPADFQFYGGKMADVDAAHERLYNTELVRQMKEWTLRNEERGAREGETAAVRQAIAERDMKKLSALRDKFVKDSWASSDDIAKPAAYVKETKIVGKAVDKETGVQSHVLKTETRHLTEGEEMADAANKKENETPRLFDETTGEEVQPRHTKSELADARDRIEARKQNSQETVENTKPATPEELKAANDHIDKTLGADMKREFVETLGGHSADWTPDAQGNVIRIATNGVGGVETNAHHESMHEFFDRLVKGKQEGVAKLLLDATNSPVVRRSLKRILAEHPAAIEAMEKDPSEALAYAYQFWKGQHPDLKLGQKAQGFFAKVAEYFRRITGLLNADEKTQVLFRSFDEGNLKDPSVAGKVLDKLNNSQARIDAVVKSTEPFRRGVTDWLGSAEDNLLKSKNPVLQSIGKKFADHNNGLLQASDRSEKQWLGKLKEILEPHDKDDIHASLEGLQTGKLSSDKEMRAIQTKVLKMLDDMHGYLSEAGVSDFNDATKKWETIKKLGGYFPRSWDMNELYGRGPEFVSRLLEHHMAELKGIADKNDGMTPEDVARSIYNRLMGSNGQEDLAEDGYSLGYSPFMKAVNRRSLKWIDMTKFHDFQNKDLVNIMSTYIMQGTKRAEYTRRFGPDGRVLQSDMEAAHRAETERVMKDNPQMSEDDAKAKALKNMEPAQRAIMAMEGTLGHDINPTLRKAQGWVLAYQNWRMLPMALFSNLIDPLGIMVRGGTLNDTFGAYKSAMSDIVNSWRGKDRQDNLMHMSEAIGTIDAHGYMSSMGTMMNSIYMAGGAKRMNDTLFRLNGMEALNRSLRGSATQAAIGFIKRHATDPNEHSERLLKELNLDAAYVKSKISDSGVPEAKGLDVTDPRIQNAIAQWVNEAILRPTSAQRPSRGSDPHYALIMHFKGFMYAMQKQILARAAKEARLGNYTPGATLALGYIPIMFASDMAKLIVQNAVTGGADMPAWWSSMDAEAHAKYAAQRAGLFGSAQIGMDAKEYGPLAALGPTAEQIGGLFTEPFKDSIMGAVPLNPLVSSAQRAVTD